MDGSGKESEWEALSAMLDLNRCPKCGRPLRVITTYKPTPDRCRRSKRCTGVKSKVCDFHLTTEERAVMVVHRQAVEPQPA